MKNTKLLTPTSDKQTDPSSQSYAVARAKAEVLKLGIDIHKREYVVVHQLDNQSPKSPQKLSLEAFLAEKSGHVVRGCYPND